MTPKLAAYIEAGKSLDDDERLEAARQLLLSLDGRDDDGDGTRAAWDDVIARRHDEVLAGSAELVDGRAAHARLRAELAGLGE